jgi:hypothetical protein
MRFFDSAKTIPEYTTELLNFLTDARIALGVWLMSKTPANPAFHELF